MSLFGAAAPATAAGGDALRENKRGSKRRNQRGNTRESYGMRDDQACTAKMKICSDHKKK